MTHSQRHALDAKGQVAGRQRGRYEQRQIKIVIACGQKLQTCLHEYQHGREALVTTDFCLT